MNTWNPANDDLDGLEEEEGQEQGEGKHPNAGEEEMREVENMDQDNQEESAISLNIVIEKAGRSKGALNVDAHVSGAAISVENVRLFDTAKLANDTSPEATLTRASLYSGPQFETLDEDLQMLIERYLEERGINSDLAMLVTEFTQHKEHQEYVRWLKGVKAFVES